MDLSQPLAYRMRPKTLEEYVGQEHILAQDKILYRTIKADRLSSIILWGPPGCGKTSLARVISETTKYKFTKINAVTSGVGDIKKAVEEAKNPFLNPSGKCILFIDEIHRFNKLQQDALLPFVEDGTVILIGATTENPYFEVNKALISRSMVFKLEPLTTNDIFKVLKMSLEREDGLKSFNVKIEDETLEKIAEVSGGDVRTALNGLEVAVLTTKVDADGYVHITNQIAADGIRRARLILSEAAVYLATSKKSNASYLAINRALEDVSSKDTGEIPMHIRNAPAEGMEQFGYGDGYKYPHDYPGHVVEQQYLPDKMLGTKYYIKDDTVE